MMLGCNNHNNNNSNNLHHNTVWTGYYRIFPVYFQNLRTGVTKMYVSDGMFYGGTKYRNIIYKALS